MKKSSLKKIKIKIFVKKYFVRAFDKKFLKMKELLGFKK